MKGDRYCKAHIVNKKRDELVGKVFQTNKSGPLEIIEYFGASDVTVKFINTGTIVTNIPMGCVRNGTVRDNYLPSVYGVGFLGDGEYRSRRNGKNAIDYTAWKSMLHRCFDEAFKEKFPTYKDCYPDPLWYNFQNFAKWYWTQKGAEDSSWNLDKDLLVKGNKIYSPETCCLIPKEINSSLLMSRLGDRNLPVGTYRTEHGTFMARCQHSDGGKIHLGCFDTPMDAFLAYKTRKESILKALAEKYKDVVDDKVYKALYQFSIETTD